jgi:hypothetical protein
MKSPMKGRLPPGTPRASDMKTDTVWAGGKRMDIGAEFGSDWIFGSYAGGEEAWVKQFLA